MHVLPRYRPDPHGVSPPSSPEAEAALPQRPARPDISPVEDDMRSHQRQLRIGSRPPPAAAPHPSKHAQPRQFAGGWPPSTSIPIMRRERRWKQAPPAAAPRTAHAPPEGHQAQGRQSPPTAPQYVTADRSHPSGHPSGLPRDAPDPGDPNGDDGQALGLTTTTIVSQNARSAKTPPVSLGHRMRHFGRHRPEPVQERPPWNGPSGRQTLAAPVYDDRSVAPLRVPQKNNAPTERARDHHHPRGNPSVSTWDDQTPRDNTPPVASDVSRPRAASAAHDIVEQGLPQESLGQTSNPDEESHATSPAAAATSPSHPTSTSPYIPEPPALPVKSDRRIRRKPPPQSGLPSPDSPRDAHLSTVQAPDSAAQPAEEDAAAPPTEGAPSPGHEQAREARAPPPPSHFSITTYSASPPVSRHSSEADGPAASQKSAASSRHRAKASDGAPSLGKALPPAPPEMVDPADRVSLLSAKLDGLAHRRRNIKLSIKQMTELMPADRLLESSSVLRKREEEKRKVERLKDELAEVQQQEYDLGLKLHRAYKRQDREDGFESGTLWVRRVTG